MSVREGRICGVPDAAVPHVLHRRSRLRGQCARRLWTGGARGAVGRGSGSTEPAPMAPRPCMCSAPKRATSSSDRTPTAQTPNDAGLDWAVGKKKTEFRRHSRHDAERSRRAGPSSARWPQDQGSEGRARRGCADRRGPQAGDSDEDDRACDVELLVGEPGRSIALAIVAGGRDRMGQTLYVPMPDRVIEVEVTDGVLRRERGAPQWLNRPQRRRQRRKMAPSAARRIRPRLFRRGCADRYPAAGRAHIAARAARIHRRALQGARRETSPRSRRHRRVRGGRTALWPGPDEWLVIDEAGGDPLADCAKVTQLHSAVGISHRNVAFAVTGPGCEATINAGCPQDLALSAFPGASSRTILGKIEIVLADGRRWFPRRMLAVVFRLRLHIPVRCGARRGFLSRDAHFRAFRSAAFAPL